jgi:signal transduction histidine kinase
MDGRGSLARRLERLNPPVVDAGIAVALAAITLAEVLANSDGVGVTPADARWSALFMLAITLPLAVRRRYPFGVMAVVGGAAIVYNVLDIPPDPYTRTFAILLAVYTVSSYASRRLAIAAAVILGVGLVALNLPGVGEDEFGDVVNQFVLLGGSWIVGQNTRFRRRETELLEERADRAEREREERERVAVLEERGRLAREIHDVIAHSVGVIAVQAGAARAVAEQRPDRAREALAAIEDVSKDTLVELRRALGALRAPGDEAALRPAPGLGVLDELVEKIRQAGVSVSLAEVGERRDVPPGVDLSAYRVVQEALTNTVKHVGPTIAHVTVHYEDAWLEVVVTDEGRSPGARPRVDASSNGGQGLIGMRERVSMLGGEFDAGPTDAGFEVRARFPLRGTAEAR